MTRVDIIKRARGLQQLCGSSNPHEAAAARQHLEALERHHKLTDAEIRDPNERPDLGQRQVVLAVECPRLIADFVLAVVGALRIGGKPSGDHHILVAGSEAEAAAGARLAQRVTALIMSETERSAERAVRQRGHFDGPSLWAGIANGFIERLRPPPPPEPSAGSARAGGTSPAQAAPEQPPEPAPEDVVMEPAEPSPDAHALVLYRPQARQAPHRRRAVTIASPADEARGRQLARDFPLEVAGDLAAPAGAAPAGGAAGPSRFARALAWLRRVGCEDSNNPGAQAFAGQILGGADERTATVNYAIWLWGQWRELRLQIQEEELPESDALLRPHPESPNTAIVLAQQSQTFELLLTWCADVGPRWWQLDGVARAEVQERKRKQQERRQQMWRNDIDADPMAWQRMVQEIVLGVRGTAAPGSPRSGG